MKKVLSLMLSTLVIFSVFTGFGITADAAIDGNYKYKVKKGKAVITKYIGNEESVVIPSKLGNKTVTEISANAFKKKKNVKEVILSDGITTIGESAFEHCSSLEKIVLGDSTTEIGGYAFSFCSVLSEVENTDQVTKLGSYPFSGTPWEESQPAGVFYVGKVANSYKDDGSDKIVIKKGTTMISTGAFGYTKNIKKITLPKSLNRISQLAFDHCTGLTEITIPGNVEVIESGAFNECKSLEKVTIKKGVKTLEGGVFANCKKLRNITIPASVKVMESNIFEGFSAKLVIWGYKNTTAHNYAGSYHIKFADLKNPPAPQISVKNKKVVTGATFDLYVVYSKGKTTFKSNNKSVANVNKKTGRVTAVSKGVATITAKVDGKKYTCKVTVKK